MVSVVKIFLTPKIGPLNDTRFQNIDEPDNFGFIITMMPYKSSILPHKIFYNAMFPEILQKCKAATKFLDFIKPAKMLIG